MVRLIGATALRWAVVAGAWWALLGPLAQRLHTPDPGSVAAELVVAAAVRYLALAAAAYLSALEALTAVAAVTRSRPLARLAAALPGVGHQGLARAVLLAALLPGPAAAAPPPPGLQPPPPVVHSLDPPRTTTSPDAATAATSAPARPAPTGPAPHAPAPPPPDAAAVDPPEVEPATVHEVRPGEHFWGIARATLRDRWGRTPTPAEIVPYWRAVIAANRDRLVRPCDPDLILPGQRFLLPPPPTGPPS